MTTVTIFRDVSHYDWDAGGARRDVSDQPMIVAKATQGDNFTDPTFDDFCRAHKYVAAYHWPDTSPLADQAADVVRVIGTTHPIMWDMEAAGATVARAATLTDEVRAKGCTVKAAYLPHNWWVQLGRPSLAPLLDRGLFIINAWYDHGYGDDAPGWDGYGGAKVTILQYTSTPYDRNAFRGTEQQLLQLWGFIQEDDVSKQDVIDGLNEWFKTDNLVVPKALPDGPRATTNPGWSLKTAIEAIVNQSWTAQQVLTGTGFADALAADLAPSLTGMTQDQIKAAVDASLAKLTLTAAAPAA